jgi:hypothetical protein
MAVLYYLIRFCSRILLGGVLAHNGANLLVESGAAIRFSLAKSQSSSRKCTGSVSARACINFCMIGQTRFRSDPSNFLRGNHKLYPCGPTSI